METHFGHLYPQPHFSGHCSKLKTIGVLEHRLTGKMKAFYIWICSLLTKTKIPTLQLTWHQTARPSQAPVSHCLGT